MPSLYYCDDIVWLISKFFSYFSLALFQNSIQGGSLIDNGLLGHYIKGNKTVEKTFFLSMKRWLVGELVMWCWKPPLHLCSTRCEFSTKYLAFRYPSPRQNNHFWLIRPLWIETLWELQRMHSPYEIHMHCSISEFVVLFNSLLYPASLLWRDAKQKGRERGSSGIDCSLWQQEVHSKSHCLLTLPSFPYTSADSYV